MGFGFGGTGNDECRAAAGEKGGRARTLDRFTRLADGGREMFEGSEEGIIELAYDRADFPAGATRPAA